MRCHGLGSVQGAKGVEGEGLLHFVGRQVDEEFTLPGARAGVVDWREEGVLIFIPRGLLLRVWAWGRHTEDVDLVGR